MNITKTRRHRALITTIIGFTCAAANAALPPNFPPLVIVSNGPVAPGDLIGTLGVKGSTTNNYNVVLDSWGKRRQLGTPG